MNLDNLPGAKIAAAAGQVSCELGDETLILNAMNNTCYRVDETGARVWQLIQTPRTVAEIRDTLVEEYEVDPARCEAAIRELIRDLAAQDLIEVT